MYENVNLCHGEVMIKLWLSFGFACLKAPLGIDIKNDQIISSCTLWLLLVDTSFLEISIVMGRNTIQ